MQERRGAGQEPGDSWPQPPLPPQREKERAEGEGREKRLWFSSTVTGKHTGSRVEEVRGKEKESGGGAGRLFIEAVFSFCKCVYASQMRGARWTVAGLCILFFSFTRTNVLFGTWCSGEKQAKRAPSKIQRRHLSPSPLRWAETLRICSEQKRTSIYLSVSHCSIHPSKQLFNTNPSYHKISVMPDLS